MKECGHARTKKELGREDPMRTAEVGADADGMLAVAGSGVYRGKSLTHLKPSQDAMNTLMADRGSTLGHPLDHQPGLREAHTPQHSKSGVMKNHSEYDERVFRIQPRVSTALARHTHQLQAFTRDLSPNLDRKHSAQQKFRPLVGAASEAGYSGHAGTQNSARNFDLK